MVFDDRSSGSRNEHQMLALYKNQVIDQSVFSLEDVFDRIVLEAKTQEVSLSSVFLERGHVEKGIQTVEFHCIELKLGVLEDSFKHHLLLHTPQNDVSVTSRRHQLIGILH